MSDAYELRACAAAPADLGFAAGQGLLYLGPHGPCYADGGSLRVRGSIEVSVGAPMLAARGALAAGLALTAAGRPLVMRQDGTGRRARIDVLDGPNVVLEFRKGRRGTVTLARGDGTDVGEMPKLPAGTGRLQAGAQLLEVGLLVTFAASMFAAALDSTRAPYGLFLATW